MKKLLGLLAAVSLVTTTGSTVVACGTDPSNAADPVISLPQSTSSVEIDGTSSVTITNASSLSDIAVVSGSPAIATVAVTSSTGVITINGVADETASITVSVDSATDVTIAVTVTKKTINLSAT